MAIPQKFAISLGGQSYNLNLYWNTVNQTWILDINDSGNNPIVNGIQLVTGIGLLHQYAYLGFVGDLFIQTSNDPDALPTYSGMGTTSGLYYTTDTSVI